MYPLFIRNLFNQLYRAIVDKQRTCTKFLSDVCSYRSHFMDVVFHRTRILARTQKKRFQTGLRRTMFLFALLFLSFKATCMSSRRSRSRLLNTTLLSLTQDPKVLLQRSFHHYANGSTNHLHHLLETITLPLRPTSTPFVVVLAANYAYRSLALNFVCNLIRLGVTNYVIFALDQPVFDYFVLQKVNTFLHTENGVPPAEVGLVYKQDKEDLFGTHQFAETSLRKSIFVLKTLKLGFSVVLSDVDVVWIQNPIPQLIEKPEDIVIQSDRSISEVDSPLNYKINSGLYLARSNPRTITAFRAIIKYSRVIRRSEQKAFNYVLCGAFKSHCAGPGLRVGTNKCVYAPKRTTVSTLEAEPFPNGSDNKLWVSTRNFSKAHPRVVAIHANYVSGREEKVRRIRRIGLWFYTARTKNVNSCVFPS